MKLYYYVSDNVLKLLRNAEIPLISVDGLKDPFLSPNQIETPVVNHTVVNESDYMAELKRQYELMPENLQSMIKFDYFYQQAESKKSAIIDEIKQSKQSSSVSISTVSLPAHIMELGVLRLFQTAVDPVLWSCLGMSYQGILLEFESDHGYFKNKKYKNKPQLLNPVKYCVSRPDLANVNSPYPLLYSLGLEWSSQQEWRLIRPLSTSAYQENSCFYYPFALTCLSGIVLGCHLDHQEKAQIINFIQSDSRYKSCVIHQLVPDKTEFQLHLQGL